jgi:hypothetical protein
MGNAEPGSISHALYQTTERVLQQNRGQSGYGSARIA